MNEHHRKEDHCMDHSGQCAEVDSLKKSTDKLWTVVDSIRGELKRVQINIAFIVGGIAVVQFFATMMINHGK